MAAATSREGCSFLLCVSRAISPAEFVFAGGGPSGPSSGGPAPMGCCQPLLHLPSCPKDIWSPSTGWGGAPVLGHR